MPELLTAIVVLLGWPIIGVALAVRMGRLGEDRRLWFVMGAVLGPVAMGLAVMLDREETAPSPGGAQPFTGGLRSRFSANRAA